ncbi:DUF3068 domain-containing protein [Tsukamurella soli]|uniref:DUF3068 domain-containing protein n=1 Tax=Tsukamurella soli TaxID=644556 RepID=A0ABP8KIU6_9ACTN
MAVGRSRLAGVLGPILIFLGALLITAAIATPLYVTGRLKTIPLNLDITSVATSTVQQDSKASGQFPSRLLDQCSITNGAAKAVVNNVFLTTQTRTLVTAPSDKNSMTVQSGMSLVVNSVQGKGGQVTHPPLSDTGTLIKDCGDGLLQAWVDRVTLNRKTAAPDGTTSETVFSPGTDAPAVKIPDRKGYQYRFPFDTSKSGTYSYYDLSTRTSVPMKFVDTRDVDGVDALHFVAASPEVDLSTIRDSGDTAPLGSTLNMSAEWWGIPHVDQKDFFSLDRYAQTTTDLWVDPKTGTLVDQVSHLRQWFASPRQTAPNTPAAVKNFSLEVFNSQQSWNQDTIVSQAHTAKTVANQIMLAKRVVPIVGGVLGVIALLLGIAAVLLSLRGGSRPVVADGPDGPDAPEGDGRGEPHGGLDDDSVTEAFTAQKRPEPGTGDGGDRDADGPGGGTDQDGTTDDDGGDTDILDLTKR